MVSAKYCLPDNLQENISQIKLQIIRKILYNSACQNHDKTIKINTIKIKYLQLATSPDLNQCENLDTHLGMVNALDDLDDARGDCIIMINIFSYIQITDKIYIFSGSKQAAIFKGEGVWEWEIIIVCIKEIV